MKLGIVRSASCVLLIASVSPAQGMLWTVDDDLPADFTTLQAAVTAASGGDTILVRQGDYDSVVTTVIDSKALNVIVEGSPTRLPFLRIQNLTASQQVILRGAGALDVNPVRGLELIANAGSVWVEDLYFYIQNLGGTLEVDSCANTVITHCRIDPAEYFDFTHGTHGAGIELVASTAWIYDTRVEGSIGAAGGYDYICSGFPGERGYPAIEARDSSLFLGGCDLDGGAGGKGATADPFCGGPCQNAGDGGPGLHIEATGSVVRVATTVSGGAGGTLAGPCSAGTPGPPVSGSGSDLALTANIGNFQVPAPVYVNVPFDVTIEGMPGDLAFIRWSNTAAFPTLIPPFSGPFLTGAGKAVFAGVVPAGGVRTSPILPGAIPFPTLKLYLQGALVRLGSPLSITMSAGSATVLLGVAP